MTTSDTKLIGFFTTLAFLLFGPFIAIVYSVYSSGAWMLRKAGDSPAKYLLLPYGILFAVLNTVHNWIVCTVLFRELPREFFTTTRLKRWKKSDDASRRELADMLGGFLDGQDPDHY